MLRLTEDEAELLADVLSMVQDCGPAPQGWQSDKLQELRFKIDFQFATDYEA